MNGVEILATEEVGINFVFNWDAFWMIASIFFGVCLMVGLIFALIDGWSNLIIGIVIGVISGGMLGCVAGADGEPTKYETHYKVIISDEVSMNEFNEKYEIISQDGKIYTIRERD